MASRLNQDIAGRLEDARIETTRIGLIGSPDHPATPVLHRDSFAHGARATLHTEEYHPTPEVVTPLYPFQPMTGRSLCQFNAGTMTGRTRNNELRPTDTLDISPNDAERLGVCEADIVRVTSQYGPAVLPVHVSPAMAPGELFATFQTPDVFVNALTGPHRDASTATPEYKITAVRIERLSAPPLDLLTDLRFESNAHTSSPNSHAEVHAIRRRAALTRSR